jgi:hypothetical protein
VAVGEHPSLRGTCADGDGGIPDDGAAPLYFAYDASLDDRDVEAKCRRTGVPPPFMECLGRGWLPDWRLVFDVRSGRHKGGVANIAPAPGCIVPGALFRISGEGLAAMDALLDAPWKYARMRHETLLDRRSGIAAPMPAILHRGTQDTSRCWHVMPSARYLNAMLRGYDAHDLPKRMLLEAANRGASLPVPVFAPGDPAEDGSHALGLWEGFACVGKAVIRGRRMHCGSFPGLAPGDEEDRVQGELHLPARGRDPGHAVELLDARERRLNKAGNCHLARRIALADMPGEGVRNILCWIYVPS